MNDILFLKNTTVAVKIDKLIKTTDKRPLADRISSRMVKCAAVLEENEHIGWQMIIPIKGHNKLAAFGSAAINKSDLEWVLAKSGKTSKATLTGTDKVGDINELYEVYLPLAECKRGSTIGFAAASPAKNDDDLAQWPAYYGRQFGELVSALRISGAALRVTLGPCNEQEQLLCKKNTLKTFDISNIPASDYIGRPVKMRVLLRLHGVPSVRVKTVIEEAVQGAKLRYIGNMNERKAAEVWDNPLSSAQVLPDYAARILMMEPETKDEIEGIETCEEEAKIIPASHKNAKDTKAVTIGKAKDATGVKRAITIGEVDLKRHYQIVGQTGTGKSTVLATLILSAIEKGHGLTFFDPHGSTIDTVLHALPEKYAERVRVVRIGDVDNPIPLNIWDSDDPSKEERNINDLCDLFGDIFDPNKEGFLGPRWERWFATFARASIAFLGRRASLEAIAVISQSQNNMLKVSRAIGEKYPELVETIKQEYGTDKSNDFQSTLNWYLCKFQRLTAIEQLRKTLGAGANALDFRTSIDTDVVTLIDLASPTIGVQASRIIGTMLLMKLWNATLERKCREKTHLVVVDEAALFQTNPMPRMLAESRKFGLGIVLSHQYTGQLSREVRDALESNSANFSAFKLSPRDAYNAAIRFEDEEMQVSLTRLNAFNAITTLSVNGKQTAPFTLETCKPKVQKNGEKIAQSIEAKSISTLVKPYRRYQALTAAEIQNLLDNPKKIQEKKPYWLNDWEQRREALAEKERIDKIMSKNEDSNLYLKVNRIIMDTAIRGKTDHICGWITLHWIIVKSFAFAYIEDAKNNSWSFRVFRCLDASAFQKNDLVFLNPSNELMKCLYDSSEKEGQREILYCEDETNIWLGEAMKAADLISDCVGSLEMLDESSYLSEE